MYEVTLENFRCFREKQTARLAPVTLLVGENSTGKTSFLAMIRALHDIAYDFQVPDFKEEPYDLGSFDEIAHHRGGRAGRADTFGAGFIAKSERKKDPASRFEFTFGKRGTAPVPVRRRFSRGKTWIDETFAPGKHYVIEVGTIRGVWEMQVPDESRNTLREGMRLYYIWPDLIFGLSSRGDRTDEVDITPLKESPPISQKDIASLRRLARSIIYSDGQRLFAGAPVRSEPLRTYDPARTTPDPEGYYIPMYLAEVFSNDKEAWMGLKERLEDFGKSAGLFDEISIKRLGRKDSEPFQVQVRKYGGKQKGPARNLIDVGYGVSQVLPVITEMLRPVPRTMFLLQQPEVHLHPSAQAALGSLFCQVAAGDRQLVVETHSDHLMDRVRMDVRDRKTNLTPDDVSILYFERDGLDVRIHSIRIDEAGNIVGAPETYRSFFMEETANSLGF